MRCVPMANITMASPCDEPVQWSCGEKIWPAIGVSIGAGLATSVGGAAVFFPSFLRSIPPRIVLAVSLALSAGVMLYVSFIEIFSKSLAEISTSPGFTEGGASAVTTVCFFSGMLFCVLLELLVHCMSKHGGGDSSVAHVCPSHTKIDAPAEAEGADAAAATATSATAASATMVTKDEEKGLDLHSREEQKVLKTMGVMTALAIAIHNFPGP